MVKKKKEGRIFEDRINEIRLATHATHTGAAGIDVRLTQRRSGLSLICFLMRTSIVVYH